ncbi:MAG: DUF58 domain-containing protein [Fibrobacteria bacterium]|nr:DUF58 domain-containing protein [Fibrobacteria bacterium]
MKPQPGSARSAVARVRGLEFRARGRIQDLLQGGHLSAFRGTGLRFREVRSYTEGDDPRHIDWNVTARSQTPFVKVFEEERELTVAFMVDVSSSLDTGVGRVTVREAAAEFCAQMAMACFGSQERLALMLHSDRLELWLPPARGPAALSRLLREVAVHPAQGRKTDLGAACDQLARRLPRRAVILVLSDFRDDPDRYGPALKRLGVRHDVNLVRVEPESFHPLPDRGLTEFLDAETGEQVLLDTSDPALAEALNRAESDRLGRLDEIARKARAVVVSHHGGRETIDSVRTLIRRRAMAGGAPR